MIVRCNLNLAVLGPQGTEHDVDPDDPTIQVLVLRGYVEQVDRGIRRPCLVCDPPQFFDSDAAYDDHMTMGDHRGGTSARTRGRATTRSSRRDRDDPGEGSADHPVPPAADPGTPPSA
jgi:hypothetical protein